MTKIQVNFCRCDLLWKLSWLVVASSCEDKVEWQMRCFAILLKMYSLWVSIMIDLLQAIVFSTLYSFFFLSKSSVKRWTPIISQSCRAVKETKQTTKTKQNPKTGTATVEVKGHRRSFLSDTRLQLTNCETQHLFLLRVLVQTDWSTGPDGRSS